MNWMERIRRHWLLFMAAAFFVPLIVIQFLFSDWLNGLFRFDAKWDAADMVSYCISYMSMVGTLFLGFATHRQGHMLNDIEERMVGHTELRALSERQPAVLLLNGKTSTADDLPENPVVLAPVEFDERTLAITKFLQDEPAETFSIRLCIVNSSKTYLELRYLVFSLYANRGYGAAEGHFGNEDFYASLAPGEKLCLALKLDRARRKAVMEGYYRLSFELYNSIGERYVEQVRFVNTDTASHRHQGNNHHGAIDTVAFGYKYFAYHYDEERYDEL